MKKLLILSLLFTVFGCSEKPKEINPNPLKIKEDSLVLVPHQDYEQQVDNPTRGKVKVYLYNNTDSVKVFYINVEEK